MSDDRPRIAELQRIESSMTRSPWTTPTGTRFLGAVSAIIDGVERQVAASAGQAPQFDDVPDVGRALADNASGIAALRNAAPVLLEIAAAARAFRDARCETQTHAWDEAERDDSLCFGMNHSESCPVDIAIERLRAAAGKVMP